MEIAIGRIGGAVSISRTPDGQTKEPISTVADIGSLQEFDGGYALTRTGDPRIMSAML
jgi:hypothetical protein